MIIFITNKFNSLKKYRETLSQNFICVFKDKVAKVLITTARCHRRHVDRCKVES